MKISTDLQEIAMSMRMVPIRSTFDRMARMVRDLGVSAISRSSFMEKILNWTKRH